MFPALINMQSATVDSNPVETTVHAYLITGSIIMHMYMDKGGNLTLNKQGRRSLCIIFCVLKAMNNRSLITSCHICMHIGHQQGCARQHSASCIKEVLLSQVIKAVGCHLSHGITLPRMAHSSWRVSLVFPDKSGKTRYRNLRFIPALKHIFSNMYGFSHQHNHFSVFAANTSLAHFYFSLFFDSFS